MSLAPEPFVSEPLTPAPPRQGLGARGVLILIALALLAGVLAAGFAISRWGGWGGWGTPAQPAAAISPQDQPTIPAQPSPNGQQIVQLPDDSISIAETAAREAALSSRIAALETRLATIDLRASAASGNAARAEGLLVAFAARRALDRGLGLGYIEQQLRERFGAGQPRAVALVIRAARVPVTLEQLRIGFDELAPELPTPVVGESWWQGFRREAAALVVVRRDATPSPRPVDRIQRARRMLEGGRVDGAMAEIARLPGRAKAEGWLAEARRYVEARRALDVIETAAIVEPQRAAVVQRSLEQAPTAATAPATPN